MADIDIRLQQGTATARQNGIATPVADTDAANKAYVDGLTSGSNVEYVDQDLTEAQQTQARDNISALGTDAVIEDLSDVSVHGTLDPSDIIADRVTGGTNDALVTGLIAIEYNPGDTSRPDRLDINYAEGFQSNSVFTNFFRPITNSSRSNRTDPFFVRLVEQTSDGDPANNTVNLKVSVRAIYGPLVILDVLQGDPSFLGDITTPGTDITPQHIDAFLGSLATISSGATDGQVLVYRGSHWTNEDQMTATGDSLNVPDDLNLDGTTLELRRGTTNIDTVELTGLGGTTVNVIDDATIATTGVTLVVTAANGFTLNFVTANQAATDAILTALFVTAMGLSAVPDVSTNNTSTRDFTLRFGDGQTHVIDGSIDNLRIISSTATSIAIAITDSSNDGTPNAISTATSLIAQRGRLTNVGNDITLESLNGNELDIEGTTGGRITFEIGNDIARTSQIPTTGTVPNSWDGLGGGGDPSQDLFTGDVFRWTEIVDTADFTNVTATQSGPNIAITFPNATQATNFINVLDLDGGGQTIGSFAMVFFNPLDNSVVTRFIVQADVIVTRAGSTVTVSNTTILADATVVSLQVAELVVRVSAAGRQFTTTTHATDPATLITTITNAPAQILQLARADSRVVVTNGGLSRGFYSIAVSGTTIRLAPVTAISATGVTFQGNTFQPFSFPIATNDELIITLAGNIAPLIRRFADIQDTPNNYVGSAGFSLSVNADGTGIIFTPQVEGAVSTIALADLGTSRTFSWTSERRFTFATFNTLVANSGTVVEDVLVTLADNQPLEVGGVIHGVIRGQLDAVAGLTFTEGNLYAVNISLGDTDTTFENTAGQDVFLFRAGTPTGVNGDLPATQSWINGGLDNGTIQTLPTGVQLQVRNLGTSITDVELGTINTNDLDLSGTGTQDIDIINLDDTNPTINTRIAEGRRVFIRIQDSDPATVDDITDDTYVEILNVTTTTVTFDRNSKFTIDAAGRAIPSTDVRTIELNPPLNGVSGDLFELTTQTQLQIVSSLPNRVGVIGELVSLTTTDTSSGAQPSIYRRIANNGNDADWVSDTLGNAFAILNNTNQIDDVDRRTQTNQILNNQTDARQETEISSLRQQLSSISNSIGNSSFTEQTPSASIPLNTDRLVTRQSWDMAARANLNSEETSDSTLRTTLDVPLLNTTLGPNRVDLSFIAELNNLVQSGSQIGYDDNDYVYVQPRDILTGANAESSQYTVTTQALPSLIPNGQGIELSLPGPQAVAGENPGPVRLLYTTLPVTAASPLGSGLGEFATGIQTVLNAEFTNDGVTANTLRNLYTVTSEVLSSGAGRIIFTRTDSIEITGIAGYYVNFISDPADTYHSLRLQDPLNSLVQTRLGHPGDSSVTRDVPFTDSAGNDLFNGYAPIIRVISTSGTSDSAITSAEWVVAPSTANYTYTDNNNTINREYHLQSYTSITDAIVNEADLQTIGNTDSGIKRIVLNGFIASNLTTYDETAPNAWVIVDGATTPDATTVYAHILDMGLVQGSTTQYYAEIDTDHLYTVSTDGDLLLNETNFRTRLSGSYVLYSRNIASGGGGSLPSIISITDSGNITEINPADGNTSISILNEELTLASEMFHRVTIPIESGLDTNTVVGTAANIRLPFTNFVELSGAVTAGSFQFSVPNEADTAPRLFTGAWDNTVTTRAELLEAVRVSVQNTLTNTFNLPWVVTIEDADTTSPAIVITYNGADPNRVFTLTPAQPDNTDSFDGTGVSATPGATTFTNGVAAVLASSVATLTITPQGGTALTAMNTFNDDATAAEVIAAIAALGITGFTIQASSGSIVIDRSIGGTFTATLTFSGGATITLGTQIIRDFQEAAATFLRRPTVGTSTLSSVTTTLTAGELSGITVDGVVHEVLSGNLFEWIKHQSYNVTPEFANGLPTRVRYFSGSSTVAFTVLPEFTNTGLPSVVRLFSGEVAVGTTTGQIQTSTPTFNTTTGLPTGVVLTTP